MNATATLPTIEPARENIFDRAACLSVELRRLGTKRKVRTGDLRAQVQTDESMIHASKDLIESEELDAIRQLDGEIRRYLSSKTSGPALFRGGVYMISYAMLAEVDAWLMAKLEERGEVLVPRFMAKWDAAVEDAERRLGDLFNAKDYPTHDEVERAFSASTRYFELGEAGGLKRVQADIFEREQRKAEAQWSAVLDESRAVLREELAGLVEHMVERLTPDASGKKKRFNATMVQDLDEFLKTFSKRAIADDPQLQLVVDEARKALSGVTPQRLRDNRYERETVRERFQELKGTLDTLVTVGARRYDLDGE